MYLKKSILFFPFCLCFYFGTYQSTDNKFSNNIISTSNQRQTTYELLQGTWINDDTTEKRGVEIKNDSLFYFNKNGENNYHDNFTLFVSPKYIDNKSQLLNLAKVKDGSYLIVYSSWMDDIFKCDRIDSLTENKLILFDKDLGKYGLYEYYHKIPSTE